jgi:hypothetical protein
MARITDLAVLFADPSREVGLGPSGRLEMAAP